MGRLGFILSPFHAFVLNWFHLIRVVFGLSGSFADVDGSNDDRISFIFFHYRLFRRF